MADATVDAPEKKKGGAIKMLILLVVGAGLAAGGFFCRAVHHPIQHEPRR